MSKSPRKSALPLLDGLELAGKRVLIRADLDAPVAEGKLLDDTRIRAAVPTIRFAHEHGARVIVAGHVGRPQGTDPALSVLAAGDTLAGLLKTEILLADDPVGDGPTKLCRDLRDGQVMMLENLRFHDGEDRNDDTFARQLAALCDVYVNDAFPACVKAQASTVGLAALVKPRVAGFRLADEVEALNRLLLAPKADFVAIVGGSRFNEQIGLIERLLPRVETLVLAGTVGLTALAAQGRRVGQSRIETGHLRAAAELLTQATRKGVEVILPLDHLAVERFERSAPVVTVPVVGDPRGARRGGSRPRDGRAAHPSPQGRPHPALARSRGGRRVAAGRPRLARTRPRRRERQRLLGRIRSGDRSRPHRSRRFLAVRARLDR
jgi:phosphoglycerate kinase